MTADSRERAGRKRRNRFVPVDEAPTGELSPRAREILALALIGFCLYALLSLATFRLAPFDGADIPVGGMRNLGGRFGYYLAFGFSFLFGFAAWLPFLFGLATSVLWFAGRKIERPTVKAIGGLVFTAMIAVWLAGPDGHASGASLAPFGAGGNLGANLSPRLQATFGGPGRILLLGFSSLVSFLLVTEWMFSSVLERTVRAAERVWRRLRGIPAVATPGGGLSGEEIEEDEEAGRRSVRGRRGENGRGGGEDLSPRQPERGNEEEGGLARDGVRGEESREGEAAAGVAIADADRQEADAEEEASEPPARSRDSLVEAADPVAFRAARPRSRRPRRKGQNELPFEGDYTFPPLDLFQEAEDRDPAATSAFLQQSSEAIVNKLKSFSVGARVVGVSVGPAVTQYEVRLDEGIRVGKLTGFEADLAAALKAVSVRIVAPIPGRDTIGVEVPNQERQTVLLRELIEQHGRAESFAIPLFLGKDVSGTPIVEDLARMPHLLIAGTTGSGKSVCINAILLSILLTRTPSQVRLILVDPKMVELQAYKAVPHLCCDVVTNMKKAPAVLQWAVDEMENRYRLLSSAGVNHIRSYNRLGQQELEKRFGTELDPDRIHLPYIVIVIDELADLMVVAAKEVEDSIQRLAQKSRAVGMHVILATQRPSTDVITGIIKANLPCQIAFKVNRKIDSRVILDSNGAEKLLGYGDMLYVPPGGGRLVRAQGTYVSDEEQQAVVRFLAEKGHAPSFLPDLVQTQKGSRPSMADRDSIYREAVEVVLGQQRGSATLLQRALSVGYTRATRLLEMMEEDGLVGPFVGSKSRDVLLTLEEWKEREAATARELQAIEEAEEDAEFGEDPGGEGPDAASGDAGASRAPGEAGDRG
ncbi:MAG: DNA translocase FtsK [Planctomycetota bacterium]